MGRELQKKKRRSKRQPIRQHTRSKKILNPRGNDMVAKNWDAKETLSQNYKRLGLVSRLRAPTGGVERLVHEQPPRDKPNGQRARSDLLSVKPIDEAIISEARVERDASGKIIRVHHSATGVFNPLNDPLRELDTDSEEEEGGDDVDGEDASGYGRQGGEEDQHGARWEEWAGIEDENDTEVVKSLVRQSRTPGVKKVRHQSQREREWLKLLVDKWGDDVESMARDKTLNRMQQTAADIRRRMKRMNE